MKKIILVLISVFLIGICCWLPTINSDEPTVVESAKTDWWNRDWQYSKIIYIGNRVNNYQMFINVSKGTDGGINCSNHCKDDFSDIRFTYDWNTTILNYWIEKKVDDKYVWLWVELPNNIESGDGRIVIYYGNQTANSISNGKDTFLYYDDFSTDPIAKTQYTFEDTYEYDFEHNRIILGANGDNKIGRMFLGLTDSNALGTTINRTRLYVKIKALHSAEEGRADLIRFQNNVGKVEEHWLHWSRYGQRFTISKIDDVEDQYVIDSVSEPYGDYYQIWLFNVSYDASYFHKYNEDNTNHIIRQGEPNNKAVQEWDEFQWHARQGLTYITLLILMNQSSNPPIMYDVSNEKIFNENPHCDFNYIPVQPSTINPVHFTDNSHDNDGTIVNWYWDFGNGFMSNQQNPVYQYTIPGNYTVCLNVTDNDGATDELCKIINVSSGGAFVDITLHVGWNLLGWYHTINTTASNLSENITGCLSISKWDGLNQTYKTYIVGGPPAFDFTISKGMGLFVDVDVASVWQGEE